MGREEDRKIGIVKKEERRMIEDYARAGFHFLLSITCPLANQIDA